MFSVPVFISQLHERCDGFNQAASVHFVRGLCKVCVCFKNCERALQRTDEFKRCRPAPRRLRGTQTRNDDVTEPKRCRFVYHGVSRANAAHAGYKLSNAAKPRRSRSRYRAREAARPAPCSPCRSSSSSERVCVQTEPSRRHGRRHAERVAPTRRLLAKFHAPGS